MFSVLKDVWFVGRGWRRAFAGKNHIEAGLNSILMGLALVIRCSWGWRYHSKHSRSLDSSFF